MKRFVFYLMLISLVAHIVTFIAIDTKYSREYKNEWRMAKMSNNIQEKANYTDEFIETVETLGFKGKFNSLNYTTSALGYDGAIETLKIYSVYLHSFTDLDPTSIEYSLALVNIKDYENNTAYKSISIINGIYYKTNYIMLWDWISLVSIIFMILMIIIFGISIINDNPYY